MPLLAEGGGAIVTIASTAAIRGHGFGPGYTASKGGVDALTRLVRGAGRARGLRANCICPGGIDTPMTGGTFATPEAVARGSARYRCSATESVRHRRGGVLPLRRPRYMTGQTIPVEGGSTIN